MPKTHEGWLLYIIFYLEPYFCTVLFVENIIPFFIKIFICVNKSAINKVEVYVYNNAYILYIIFKLQATIIYFLRSVTKKCNGWNFWGRLRRLRGRHGCSKRGRLLHLRSAQLQFKHGGCTPSDLRYTWRLHKSY